MQLCGPGLGSEDEGLEAGASNEHHGPLNCLHCTSVRMVPSSWHMAHHMGGGTHYWETCLIMGPSCSHPKSRVFQVVGWRGVCLGEEKE